MYLKFSCHNSHFYEQIMNTKLWHNKKAPFADLKRGTSWQTDTYNEEHTHETTRTINDISPEKIFGWCQQFWQEPSNRTPATTKNEAKTNEKKINNKSSPGM